MAYTPTCRPAIGCDDAGVEPSGTDREEAGVGINTRGTGRIAAIALLVAPACRPTIGFDAAGMDSSGIDSQKLSINIEIRIRGIGQVSL